MNSLMTQGSEVMFVDSGRGPLRGEDRFPQTNPPLKSQSLSTQLRGSKERGKH
ncbi:Uncharacterized protein DAT39_000195 [Clarias magur]|uniref:Uncharacterized protein n=1 Tax=Clarias magur TaxID=1594786 RepID=A0A8J4XLD8_CLAMG|nr:Uncharacterized protein DAT39_000195 [Clarias magur]